MTEAQSKAATEGWRDHKIREHVAAIRQVIVHNTKALPNADIELIIAKLDGIISEVDRTARP